MIRSRRLALAALVVAFGVASCGDPTTTAPSAQQQPKVIQLASGRQAAGGFAPAPASASADSAAAGGAESKMAVFAPTEFVYAGDLPALDGPARSWFFDPAQQPDPDRIAKIAAALGVQGEVRTVPEDQGGGWAVGPADFSAPVLTVGRDGLLSWWLSAAPATISSSGCASIGVATSEPAPGAGVAGSSGTATDVATPDTALPVDVPAPDVPECAAPEPPPGVPTKDEALAKAKELFASLGYDVNAYQFDDIYADEWGATVNGTLVLDGMKTQVMLSVGFGENATITWASGTLGVPQPGSDYPTIGAAAGLERLKDQQLQTFGGVGIADTGVVNAATEAVAPQPAAGAPAIAPCESIAATGVADCAPVDTEPITVTLNSVKRDLTMVWAADNTVWLLPAYTFGTADGGMYTVNAVDDSFLQEPDPVATTEPVIEPNAGGGTAPAPSVAETCAPPSTTPFTTPTPSVKEVADYIVGSCLAAAQELAKTFGYEVRVARQDGEDLAVTADFSEKRINVAVENGAVTEVLSIG